VLALLDDLGIFLNWFRMARVCSNLCFEGGYFFSQAIGVRLRGEDRAVGMAADEDGF
jgi:hypothetical protein